MGEFIGALRDISAIAAACVAIYGVNTWRRDFIGKRQIELAEDTLILFYQAKDVVEAIRSPAAFSDEIAHIEQGPGESLDKFHARKIVAPLFKRYEAHAELFAKLASTRYQVMARFGEDAAVPFDMLNSIIRELLSSAHLRVVFAGEAMPHGDVEAERKLAEKLQGYEAVIWYMGEGDPIAKRLEEMMVSVEAVCGKVIRSQLAPPIWWGAMLGCGRSFLKRF